MLERPLGLRRRREGPHLTVVRLVNQANSSPGRYRSSAWEARRAEKLYLITKASGKQKSRCERFHHRRQNLCEFKLPRGRMANERRARTDSARAQEPVER